MIGPNHPVREAFAACSTGNDGGKYYDSKEIAFATFNAALTQYGWHLDDRGWPGNSDYRMITIWDNDCHIVGDAHFTWYKMDSGRWEVIGYIT